MTLNLKKKYNQNEFYEPPSRNSLDKHTNTPDKIERSFNNIIMETSGLKLKKDLETKNNQTKFDHQINHFNKNQKKKSIEDYNFENFGRKQNPTNKINFNSSLNNNFHKEKNPINIYNESLDNPFNLVIEKRNERIYPAINNFKNYMEFQTQKTINNNNNFTNLNKPLNKDNLIQVKIKDNLHQKEDNSKKANEHKENPDKQFKITKKEFSEDSFKANENKQMLLQEKEHKNKHAELFKAYKPLNYLESQINDKYIFDTSKEKAKFKAPSDSSDIDKMISDIDKNDYKHNLFGKPFPYQPNAEVRKPQQAFIKKENLNPKINANSNVDLFQIFGDCINKPQI